jgi:hypothetical protein
MFGRTSHLNPLALRKKLLIAESEINRAQLAEQWQAIGNGTESLATRVKTVSSVASVAAVLAVGLSAFRRTKSQSTAPKTSWFPMALKGAQAACSIWLAFRSREQ